MSKWVRNIKLLHNGTGVVSDIINLRNGALVSCGGDRSINFWEEKKADSACACCNIF